MPNRVTAIERHRRASTIVTSNRAIEEWIPLFDDPILAQSARDRLAHNAHQVALEVPLPKEDEVAAGDSVATMGSRVREEVRRP